ncbi:carbon-nitrogen hydrolase family protein [Candidatus Roizmanbacteria bacterium]|nr:carbon-nitrogen hydrolase family protein [Candidatus Roizmanbacteria bacterium]
MKLNVAVSQYKIPEKVEDSIEKLDEIAAQAAKQNVQLLVAPETAIGALVAIATTFYTTDNSRYYNQGYIVSSTGEILHTHRKIYLAPPERDTDGISAGNNVAVSKTPLGNLSMLICKDGFNRFSHFLYEKLNKLGAEIICIPTWSLGWDEMKTDEYVNSLFVYGAFASRAFVLVSGNLNKETKSFGRSLIVSPIRGVLQKGSRDKEELFIADIDLEEVKKARAFDSWWQPAPPTKAPVCEANSQFCL